MTPEAVDGSFVIVSHTGPEFVGIEVDWWGNFGSRYSKRRVSK
jgi:hypothetical protein